MASNRELAAKVPADPKRIVVACDGTWDDSDYGMKRNLPWEKETAVPPSNVTRICRSIKKFDEVHKKQQIVYYQAGIGSEHTLKDKFWGGLTGFGISEHVREAYAFLAHNYVEGDEIILLGFSRGAFTARTIGAMVADLGILSMKGMSYFFPIFKDWENKILPGYVSPFQEPFPADVQKPSVGASGEPYQNFLVDQGYTTRNIPVQCIGVWDTVGSLGIPSVGMLPNNPVSEYTFVDTMVPWNVKHAFHALALDEHRKPFSPTIWEKPADRGDDLVLKQCWFPGAHANVGGGYEDTMSADITLAWMVSQMIKAKILAFDLDYIKWQWQLNIERYGAYPLAWGLGRIDDSFSELYHLAGSVPRTPASYYEIDPLSGRPTNKPCQRTNETVHASVRIRKGLRGRGLDDHGLYNPPSLDHWICTGVGGTADDSYIKWILPGHESLPGHEEKSMPEDELSELELALIGMSPLIKDNIWKIQGTNQSKL